MPAKAPRRAVEVHSRDSRKRSYPGRNYGHREMLAQLHWAQTARRQLCHVARMEQRGKEESKPSPLVSMSSGVNRRTKDAARVRYVRGQLSAGERFLNRSACRPRGAGEAS